MTDKAAVRAALRAALRAVPEATRASASARTVEAVDALPGPLVAAWMPLPIELDVRPLLRALLARDGRLALPRVAGDVLCFHAVTDLDALIAGPLGLREPAADLPEVALTEVSAMLVPGLGFDARGGRLGWGRGYYDRALAALPARVPRFALALRAQQVPEVPMCAHDQPVFARWL